MPAYTYCQGHGWQNQWYNSTATTTQYIPVQQWVNNSSTITTHGLYYPTTSNSYSREYRWTDEVWGEWVSQQTSYTYQPQVMTAEAIIEADRRMQEEREQRRLASVRARTLLDGFLSDEQKGELETQGRFHVTGSRGRRYCIRAAGQSGNVDLLKPDGSVQARLCCHPRGGLPEGDAWLVQMMEIRHDEDHFLRTANVHRGSLPGDVGRELIAA